MDGIQPDIRFAELHGCSYYSFLRGASSPDDMIHAAAKHGLTAIALLDRDGLYGAVQAARAAKECAEETTRTPTTSPLTAPATSSTTSSATAHPAPPANPPTITASSIPPGTPPTTTAPANPPSTPPTTAPGVIFGAELTLDGPLWGGHPGEQRLLAVLCTGPEGYRRLSHAITTAALASGEKGRYHYPSLEELGDLAGEEWIVLADDAWTDDLATLTRYFPRVVVELDHLMIPNDADRHERQLDAAAAHQLPAIISARPTAAHPRDLRLAAAKGALAHRDDLYHAQPYTLPLGGTFIRSGAELAAAVAPTLGGDIVDTLLANTADIAAECTFTLDVVTPQLPRWSVPAGTTEDTFLAELVAERAPRRYGTRAHNPAAWRQLDYELGIIAQLGFSGYFLIVNDIVEFCGRSNILAQGRGSSANSAVCYALGITNVDPVAAELLFERFLSPERDGPPDIDLDIESGRREEVIQYVYQRYGRANAAQVANVITYRRRGALRDAARALGYPDGRIDAWVRGTQDAPADVHDLAAQLLTHPRHLGIHSAGMVMCDRPIADVVPVEWARREGRSVIQWDKDDCAWAGLVKFDLLGLGMLEALHYALDNIRENHNLAIELWQLGFDDPEVYAMLSRGDAVGVFQVESRAQIATLPRLKPANFYDLVVQVSLIRPGPIQGGSVHPYIRRRNGREPVAYDHPCLEPALAKTLGVPLFQEQVMRVAVDAAGFSPAEADSLRRAMGFKRSNAAMQRLRDRFAEGCRTLHGMDQRTIDALWSKIIAFASYGFPESHAQSFASIVYFSAWMKRYFPAEFTAALLRAQPMGFYSPQSLVADARRHGVTILPVDVNHSDVHATASPGQRRFSQDGGQRNPATLSAHPRTSGSHPCTPIGDPSTSSTDPSTPRHTSVPPKPGTPAHLPPWATTLTPGALRLGLGSIKGLGAKAAQRIVDARREDGPFTTMADIARRAGINASQMEALAQAGALESLGVDRRQGLWASGVAATEQASMLPGLSDLPMPSLPGMTAFELAAADIATTGISATEHPVALLRATLTGAGVCACADLARVEDSTRQRVGGAITHRQRPMTAGGVVFLGLEDETGVTNILCSEGVWARYGRLAKTARMVVVRGIVQNASGAVTVIADRIDHMDMFLRAAEREQAARSATTSGEYATGAQHSEIDGPATDSSQTMADEHPRTGYSRRVPIGSADQLARGARDFR